MPDQSMVACRNLAFSYDSAESPLFTNLSAHFPPGFTGVVGANGAGKTTFLRLMIGQLMPTGGTIEGTRDAVYCAQRTDEPPDRFEEFLNDWDGEACELRGRLDVDYEYLERWVTLSHGERKRAQIAHALWQSPSLLAIDEPTNHIDAGARGLLLDALKRYSGVGLIVSHDRALLDELCTQCLWLEPPTAQMYTGGITQTRAQMQSAHATAVRDRKKLVSENKRLQREMVKRRDTASREHSARSKKGLAKKDSDAREKIDRARVSDGGAGSQLRQLGGRSAQLQARLDTSHVKKVYETGVWLEDSKSPRDTVLNLDAGEIAFASERVLRWPQLAIKADQRIAITGNNGIGKSTWINHVLPLLNVPSEHVVFLPQEVSAATARELMAEVRALPNEKLGHIMNVVSRLNSRPERLLESHQPSPGEVRKLLLAMGLSRQPHIIVMDEPTNHLDLPSIEALEAALADCPCALLMVSHDQDFIERVGAQSWQVASGEEGVSLLVPVDR